MFFLYIVEKQPIVMVRMKQFLIIIKYNIITIITLVLFYIDVINVDKRNYNIVILRHLKIVHKIIHHLL